MDRLQITIFGGTGFVGRHLAPRLLREGHDLTLVSRHPPDSTESLNDHLLWIRGDLLEAASVTEAVNGADAVINLVGAVTLPNAQAYFDLHQRGARQVAEACRDAPVKQLIHISALGVAMDAPSAADRSKAAGERAVWQAFPTAVIVRPSLMFAEDDHLLNLFERVSKNLPVIPVLGADTRFQPLHVDDLCEAMARILSRPDSQGRLYQAGGPEVLTLIQVVRLLMASLGRKRLVMPIPSVIAMPIATLVGCFPGAPINRQQVALMKTDKIVAAEATGLKSWILPPDR